MFGLDFGTIGGILLFTCFGLVIGGLIVAAWMKRADPEQTAKARAELARVRAGETDRIDNFYKETPLYDAAKQLEESGKRLIAGIEAAADKALSRIKQEQPVAQSDPAVESLEEWAARNAMTERLQELQTVSAIHPGLTWDQVGALVNDPHGSRDVVMTPGDKSTVAAATGR